MLKGFDVKIKNLLTHRFNKFVVVGAINTCVDFSVFNLVLFILPSSAFGLSVVSAKILGFIVASTNSYLINLYWTFKSSTPLSFWRYVLFLCVSGSGLAINIACAYVVYTFGIQIVSISHILMANIAFLVATLVSLVWNYLGYKQLVFKQK